LLITNQGSLKITKGGKENHKVSQVNTVKNIGMAGTQAIPGNPRQYR